MSSSTNIPNEPMTPNRQESAPPNAGWRTKLQSRRARRSIPRRADSSVPQLSFAQEQLWLLEQLEPGSPAYNRPFALRLTGRLDESALRRSLQKIVDRHEILRTRFVAGNGQALPVVSRSHTLQLPLIEPADADSAQRLEHAVRLAKEESLRPFDLAHESPFRAALLRLSSEDHVLLVVFHHIAFDGWSARVFMEELPPCTGSFARASCRGFRNFPSNTRILRTGSAGNSLHQSSPVPATIGKPNSAMFNRSTFPLIGRVPKCRAIMEHAL